MKQILLIILLVFISIVGVSQIQVGTNFDIFADAPIDTRLSVVDISTRNALIWRYEGLIVYVEADSVNYQLQGDTTNADWYAISSGGTSGLWKQTNNYLYPLTLTDWVGINTLTPIANFNVNGGHYIFGGSGDINNSGGINFLDAALMDYSIASNTFSDEALYSRSDILGNGIVSGFTSNILQQVNLGNIDLSNSDDRMTIKTIVGKSFYPYIPTGWTGDWYNIDYRIGYLSSNSSLMIIKADGKVGIGIDSPIARLDVIGTTILDTLSLLNNIQVDTIENILTNSQTNLPTSRAVSIVTSALYDTAANHLVLIDSLFGIDHIQTLTKSNDTIYLSNDGYVVLLDDDPTNEIQDLSGIRDSIELAYDSIGYLYDSIAIHRIELNNIHDSISNMTTGTVTEVIAGDGMDFTTITDSDSVHMGTPSPITYATSDTVTATSHTHSVPNGAITSGTLNQLSTAVSTPAYALNGAIEFSIITGTIVNSGTALATGDQIYDFVQPIKDSIIISMAFDTLTGVLTLNQHDGGTITKDLDGRYLTEDYYDAQQNVYEKELTDAEVNIAVGFTINSTSLVFLNGTALKDSEWSGEGSTTLILALATKQYDNFLIKQ